MYTFNIILLYYYCNKIFGGILQVFFNPRSHFLEAALPQALMAALQTTLSIGPEPLADFLSLHVFLNGGVSKVVLNLTNILGEGWTCGYGHIWTMSMCFFN